MRPVWVLWVAGCTPPDGDGPVPTPTDPGPVVELAQVSTCADPQARAASGPFSVQLTLDSTPSPYQFVAGAGIAAGDLDGDGLLELVTIRDHTFEYLALDRHTGLFEPRAGLPPLDTHRAFGATAADPDGDGDLDLLITRWGQPNQYLRNRGDGSFDDATADAGLAGPDAHHSASATFADLDGDGDLDVAVAGHGFVDESGVHPSEFEPGDPTLLYENLGDGTFVDRSDGIPESVQGGYSFLAGATDFDMDGDLDLMLVNDFGRSYDPGHLLWNEGGLVFEADGGRAGLDVPFEGMGLAFADVNQDGVPDALVPHWSGYKLLLSDPGGTWINWSQALRLAPALQRGQTVGWGALFGDMDADGQLDAKVMHGWVETTIAGSPITQPNATFMGLDGVFENVSEHMPEDHSMARGLVLADLDADGWLDHAFPDLSGPTSIHMGRCNDERALLITLDQPGMNRFGVGAVIEVSDADGWSAWRQVTAGGDGYGSGSPPEIHVGVGEREIVDIRIRWPDGEVQELSDQATGRRIRIRRPRL